jgi:6-phosphogluconate dehydrogenase
MKLGFIGLGKMGKGLVLSMREKGIEVLAWNRTPNEVANVSSIEEMVKQLEPGKRVIWLMVLSTATDEILSMLKAHLSPGDLVIDGGNVFYKDDIRRAKEMDKVGVRYMDIGVSGGPKGAREGACLMIGGDKDKYEELTNLWEAISSPKAYAYFGKVGAGHFAKMIHNGIEYGMMQAIAEGAAILKASQFEFDLANVFKLYNNRSVIESRLVGWAQEALAEDPELKEISSQIGHLGEGEWTAKTAKELGIEAPVIQASFDVRVKSVKEKENFRNKVVSALRGKFGGHAVGKGDLTLL